MIRTSISQGLSLLHISVSDRTDYLCYASVIDWDFNFAVPIQKAATFPKFFENVPGAAPPGMPESHAYLDLSADKSQFLSILAEKERERTHGTSFTKLIETSSERNFFFSKCRFTVRQYIASLSTGTVPGPIRISFWH